MKCVVFVVVVAVVFCEELDELLPSSVYEVLSHAVREPKTLKDILISRYKRA